MELLALNSGHSQGCTILYKLGGKYQSDMNEILLCNNICKCYMRITLEWCEVLLIIAPMFSAICMEGLCIKVCNVLLPGEICHFALLTLPFAIVVGSRSETIKQLQEG